MKTLVYDFEGQAYYNVTFSQDVSTGAWKIYGYAIPSNTRYLIKTVSRKDIARRCIKLARQ